MDAKHVRDLAALELHRYSARSTALRAASFGGNPANTELDFKALAHYTGDRRIEMLPLKEVQAATGYIRGGVTVVACKKNYSVYIDELAQICDVISISAGMRGLQILLAPEDYIRAVKGRVAPIAKPV